MLLLFKKKKGEKKSYGFNRRLKSIDDLRCSTVCVSVMLILDFKQNRVCLLFLFVKCFECVFFECAFQRRMPACLRASIAHFSFLFSDSQQLTSIKCIKNDKWWLIWNYYLEEIKWFSNIQYWYSWSRCCWHLSILVSFDRSKTKKIRVLISTIWSDFSSQVFAEHSLVYEVFIWHTFVIIVIDDKLQPFGQNFYRKFIQIQPFG